MGYYVLCIVYHHPCIMRKMITVMHRYHVLTLQCILLCMLRCITTHTYVRYARQWYWLIHGTTLLRSAAVITLQLTHHHNIVNNGLLRFVHSVHHHPCIMSKMITVMHHILIHKVSASHTAAACYSTYASVAKQLHRVSSTTK